MATTTKASVTLLLTLIASTCATSLGAQRRAPALIRDALQHFESRRLDSARSLFLAVLDTATLAALDERQTALIWLGIIAHAQGQDTLTRAYFRHALASDTSLTVDGLAEIDPELERIFAEERRAAFSVALVHLSGSVDEPPQRVSGPPLAYPAKLLRRPVAGTVRVSLVVDTAGRAEPRSIEILEVPDSALIDPVKAMFLASQFRPGRHRGRAVRVRTVLRLDVRPRGSTPRSWSARRGLCSPAVAPTAQWSSSTSPSDRWRNRATASGRTPSWPVASRGYGRGTIHLLAATTRRGSPCSTA